VIRVREHREAQRLTLDDVARRIGMTKQNLSSLELEKSAATLPWLRRIAALMNVSVAELLGDEDNPWRLTDRERELVTLFRGLPESSRAQATAMLKILKRDPE
jgi:transcriptional regulator with XRE-family HTH domain